MAFVHLESIEDPRLDIFARLTEAQLRNKLEPEKGIFIAESFKVIDRALAGGMKPIAVLMTPSWVERAASMIARIEAAARAGADVPIYVVPEDQVRTLTGFALTRGIICAMHRPQLPTMEELLTHLEEEKRTALHNNGEGVQGGKAVPNGAGAGASVAGEAGDENMQPRMRVAVLEGIVDHTNVGAIFRSAAALGVDAVLVSPTCCDPLYRRSVRVSMGTVFQVPWTRIGESLDAWPAAGIERLRALGYKTAAMALSDDSIALGNPELAACDKLALVFGTEGDGLAHETITGCDYTVRIPMRHDVDSLNVAAASAVAFWELCGR